MSLEITNITQLHYGYDKALLLAVCEIRFEVKGFILLKDGKKMKVFPGMCYRTTVDNGKFVESLLDSNRIPYMTQLFKYLKP